MPDEAAERMRDLARGVDVDLDGDLGTPRAFRWRSSTAGRCTSIRPSRASARSSRARSKPRGRKSRGLAKQRRRQAARRDRPADAGDHSRPIRRGPIPPGRHARQGAQALVPRQVRQRPLSALLPVQLAGEGDHLRLGERRSTLRTYGGKRDAYAVFKAMLDKGNPPDSWSDLAKAVGVGADKEAAARSGDGDERARGT